MVICSNLQAGVSGLYGVQNIVVAFFEDSLPIPIEEYKGKPRWTETILICNHS